MKPQTSSLVVDGAFGGTAAGVIVAFWFLVLDIAAGQPLATPTLLAETALHQSVPDPTLSVVAVYTVLHLGVFAALGVVAAVGLDALGLKPQLRYGVVFGIGVLNAVHYGAILATESTLLSVLPGLHVFSANILAGMGLMFYLHRAQSVSTSLGFGGLRENPRLAQALLVGGTGALAVALWFFALDIVSGRPFFTPAALGSAVLLGAQDPGAVEVSAGIIAAYTVIHLLVFVAAGAVLVWASGVLEKTPGLWLLGVMIFIVFEAGFVGVAGAMGGWVLGALGWWAVVVGNLLAAAAMGYLIWKTHPVLRRRFTQEPVPTMV